MAPPPSPGTAELPGGSGQKRSVTKTVKTTTTTTRRRDPPGRYGPPPEQTSALVDEIFKMLQEPLPAPSSPVVSSALVAASPAAASPAIRRPFESEAGALLLGPRSEADEAIARADIAEALSFPPLTVERGGRVSKRLSELSSRLESVETKLLEADAQFSRKLELVVRDGYSPAQVFGVPDSPFTPTSYW